ncbi:hypothetical protein [Flavobacterium frigidarium]|uniref:hypothetical protein n=1 Tax=Flavobacterium frigidarium TaxID=99286 RepID=UPI0004073A5F|nr:hypothetical protein [Flavobacterium frigidarium]
MDIQSRKLEFIQAFLKIQSEEVISQLENILRSESAIDSKGDSEFNPMSLEEFNERIDTSENDFENGRYKKTSELLKKYN